MQKMILLLNKYNKYDTLESEGNNIWILECFLNDIILNFFTSYIDWATNQTDEPLETNSTLLEKQNENIIIRFLYSTNPNEEFSFTISNAQFVSLLHTWKKLVEDKTKKIIIIQSDNGTMTIEGE